MARVVNVVRHLAETGGVPPQRLLAAGCAAAWRWRPPAAMATASVSGCRNAEFFEKADMP